MSEPTSVTIFDLEPVVMDLRSTATLLGAMITKMQQDHTTDEEDDYVWRKLEGEFITLTRRTVDLWGLAFEHHRDEVVRLKAEHETALATVKAEKAAPGSVDDRKHPEAMWSTLRAVGVVLSERCAEAGYPIELPAEEEPT